jgi:hypothetical protein
MLLLALLPAWPGGGEYVGWVHCSEPGVLLNVFPV